ncbi:MAG: DDE-type integrase/transposase/recombinase [Candidatus Phlomobacter fragariae]
MLRLTPKLAKVVTKKRKIYGGTWYLDETYIKVKRRWHYLYRAVNGHGETIDFMLSKKLNKKSDYRFLRKAIDQNTYPTGINIDKSKVTGQQSNY